MTAAAEPLLSVKDLRVSFNTPRGRLTAVDGVSFDLSAGERLGLVGESGCGKSTAAYALMGLLPANAEIGSGSIRLEGTEMVGLAASEVRKRRWQDISIIFQNAMTALNPVLRIGDQLTRAVMAHQPISRAEALDRAAEIFGKVGISASRLMHYPHEFSGGMKQRAVIALALICRPKIVIADEPTTALDVVAQRQVLELLTELTETMGLSLVLISHDISAVSETCTKVAVMYAGQIVEQGPTRQTLLGGRHPYTRALVGSLPSIYSDRGELTSIEGTPPDLVEAQLGCRFAPRCSHVQAVCRSEAPPEIIFGGGRTARCHFARDLNTNGNELRHAVG